MEKLNFEGLPLTMGDPNFSNTITSIVADGVPDPTIRWVMVEEFCEQGNYSADVDDLEVPVFCNKAIGNALLILNWFVPEGFSEVFENRKVKPGCLYEYKIMIDGVILRTFIDSFVPVKENRPIFA